MLHERIDPTVDLLRKNQPRLKRKRVETDKDGTASVPPISAPSWCLNEEALKKFNRSTDHIPIYDYDTETHNDDSENETSSDDEIREIRKRKTNDNESRENQRRKRKKSSKSKKSKKSKNK